MRRIGTIPSQSHSERFQNYLASKEIPCRVDPAPEGWEVWIYREDQLDSARKKLTSFLEKPDSAEFNAAPPRPVPPPEPDVVRTRRVRRAGPQPLPWRRPIWERMPLTLFLIVASVLVTVVTNFGSAYSQIVQALAIQPYRYLDTSVGTYIVYDDRLGAIFRHGEIWRLFTPMFLHGNWLHLGFNMYATWILAGVIEHTQGPRRLLWITLLVAAPSHLLQFFVDGPAFAGMSGALYGWFGYLWARGVLEPRSEVVLPRAVVYQLLAWLVLCFTGILGPIANWAHLGGLIGGLAVGGLPPLFRRFFVRYR